MNAKTKALNKKKPYLQQISKEYFKGKWQKVGFYTDKEGSNKVVDVRPIKN